MSISIGDQVTVMPWPLRTHVVGPYLAAEVDAAASCSLTLTGACLPTYWCWQVHMTGVDLASVTKESFETAVSWIHLYQTEIIELLQVRTSETCWSSRRSLKEVMESTATLLPRCAVSFRDSIRSLRGHWISLCLTLTGHFSRVPSCAAGEAAAPLCQDAGGPAEDAVHGAPPLRS